MQREKSVTERRTTTRCMPASATVCLVKFSLSPGSEEIYENTSGFGVESTDRRQPLTPRLFAIATRAASEASVPRVGSGARGSSADRKAVGGCDAGPCRRSSAIQYAPTKQVRERVFGSVRSRLRRSSQRMSALTHSWRGTSLRE